MTDNGKQKHLVIFQPSGRRGYVDEGKTIKEASQELGVELESVCGGQAICGKCKVRIMQGFFERYSIDSRMGHLSAMEEKERKFLAKPDNKVGSDYRLACVARIYGDVLVFVPEESRVGKQVVRKSVTGRSIDLKLAVKKYYAEVAPAALSEPLGDWERLQAELNRRFGLDNLIIDYEVLRSLQKIVRQGDWKVTVSVWMNREVIKIEPRFVEQGYGLAVDIGTTTVAGYLCNLTTGEVVATDSMVNPQVTYGEDVMSRITYAMVNQGGLRSMNEAIIKSLNQIAGRVSLQVGIKRHDIPDMTIGGNTCMHHLSLAIDPEYLGRAPFTPSIHHSLDIKARDLGLKISKGAYIHVLPIEAGFVGADNVGVLIAEEPYNQGEMMLIIDIGTNGELVLGNREKLIVSSCATGPALEGASIKYGMRAAAGAIERVEIDPDTKEVRFQVIGKASWMYRLGVKRLDKILLAGAFGSYIDKRSAMVIGLLPDCDLENVYAVGNAAGEGARLALLSVDKRREANEIARRVEYVELTTEPAFERQFTQAMYFPHMKDPFPHLKRLLLGKGIA